MRRELRDPIFEYIGGRLTIHHGPECHVMTNSPVYDEQLALNKYWQGIGGTTMLPGTYYFESARDPNVFWVDLDDINFKAGAPVKRLLLTGDEIYAGNVAKQFKTAEPFTFLCATV